MSKQRDKEKLRQVRALHILADLAGRPMSVYDALTVRDALARAANTLRARYEAECSHQWADTDAYRASTERRAATLLKRVSDLGLHGYLQTDPRGATLYVSDKPIDPSNYVRELCIY